MSPRPPTSTLFPYTTLFRSVLDLPDVGRDQRGANRLQPLGAVVDEDRDQLGEQVPIAAEPAHGHRSEEHTSELQSLRHLVCRLLLEKKTDTCTDNLSDRLEG